MERKAHNLSHRALRNASFATRSLPRNRFRYAVNAAEPGKPSGMFGTLVDTVVMRLVKLLSIIVTVALFIACWEMFYSEKTGSFPSSLIWMLYAVLVIGFNRTYNAYEVGMGKVPELIYSQILTDLISAGIVYAALLLGWPQFSNPLPLLGLIAVQALWSGAWCFMANKLCFSIYPPPKTAIVYQREGDLRRLGQIKEFSNKFNIQKYIKDPCDIHQLLREVDGYAAIFVVGINATLRNGIAKYCIEKGVQGYIAPHVGDVIMAGSKHMQLFSMPIVRIDRAPLSLEYMFIKRAFDIIGALISILITSPLMLGIAAAIRLNDGGPILYKQLRLTRDRREFMIWKFRSMRVDAERDGTARLAGEHDDRVTSVGKVIRTIRFDELPQLFNILGGSMTFVGPRPERPEIAAKYEEIMPSFSLRLQVKAGLTGYAQVYGKYNTEPYDKLQMDLMYINKMSLLEDLRLMLATVKTLFMKESTEGVGEGQTTAVYHEIGKESA